ncbi:hypothetical protein SDRG_06724 [Saprolegnia diclina VS20]|uniref:Ataxin-10 domain-containing protein n=1 Tax=Saprolegnia diclina (strain VS20) TaxID=1156394 RepID=T0S074_SAPDV|nr:hypothetical protein SDRG_06724 [Saprolegnia diclina VS20]EQC35982.1 hypothetical protein SDRG_06724 [Saprolegnia diclina VS20]|eukprot:XP_008610744.1 hypothetical protein SDRG_06724 [Saprolegnia diclina VS20]
MTSASSAFPAFPRVYHWTHLASNLLDDHAQSHQLQHGYPDAPGQMRGAHPDGTILHLRQRPRAMAAVIAEALAMIQSQSPLLSADGLSKMGQITFNQPLHKVEAGKLGVISAIVEALKRSIDNGSMQEDGCRVLRNIAFQCESNLNLVQSQGAIAAVAEALNRHMTNDAVVAEGFWALVVFCANHHGNTLVAKALVPNVATIAAHHTSNAEIQKKAMFLGMLFA